MREGDVQNSVTSWWRKLGFDVCPGAGRAPGGRAHLVARLYYYRLLHPARAVTWLSASFQSSCLRLLLARHGMIDVVALHVLTIVTGRGWDVGVGACGPQARPPGALALLQLFGCNTKKSMKAAGL